MLTVLEGYPERAAAETSASRSARSSAPRDERRRARAETAAWRHHGHERRAGSRRASTPRCAISSLRGRSASGPGAHRAPVRRRQPSRWCSWRRDGRSDHDGRPRSSSANPPVTTPSPTVLDCRLPRHPDADADRRRDTQGTLPFGAERERAHRRRRRTPAAGSAWCGPTTVGYGREAVLGGIDCVWVSEEAYLAASSTCSLSRGRRAIGCERGGRAEVPADRAPAPSSSAQQPEPSTVTWI